MQRFQRERDFPTDRLAEFWCEKIMFNECCCIEPTLDELLGDSAVRLLMRRDGVTEADIRALVSNLKDVRTVVLDRAERGHGAAISAADQREIAVYSRAAKSSVAGKIPIRFI